MPKALKGPKSLHRPMFVGSQWQCARCGLCRNSRLSPAWQRHCHAFGAMSAKALPEAERGFSVLPATCEIERPWTEVGAGAFLYPVRRQRVKIAGGGLHISHAVALLQKGPANIVICCKCGGFTTGRRTMLLAKPCSGETSPSRARSLTKASEGTWPTTAVRKQFGGQASDPCGTFYLPIQFTEFRDGFTVVSRFSETLAR